MFEKPFTPPPLIIRLPKLRMRGVVKLKRRKKKLRRKAKYQPSLVGVEKRIFMAGAEKLMTEGKLTGFGIRPIPI